MHFNDKNNKILIYIIKMLLILFVAFAFMSVFSFWTTPFYKDWYGCDASFFTLAGRAILKGYVPYRDFFDLKGPYFFFFEALGQLICKGRTGAFILQVFALFASILLLIKISKLFISNKKTAVIVCLFLFFHASTLWGGNTLEEFCLPLSFLCLYLVCLDYINNSHQLIISNRTALIIGISFGVISFSKITVSAPIVGIVLTIFYIYLRDKQYKKFALFSIYSILGILLAVAPVFIYFGINNAISDMIYSVFIFAFKRSVDFRTRFNLKWELKISGCYFAIIFALCHLILAKRNDDKIKYQRQYDLIVLTLLMSVVTAICLHLGEPYIYYFTSAYPCMLFAIILIFTIYDPLTLLDCMRLDIPMIAFIIPLCYFASCSGDSISTVIYDLDNTYYAVYKKDSEDIAAIIPECDRDSVYSFNIDMQWYEINDLLPCYKYPINLEYFMALDENIESETLNYIKETPPKWLVVGDDLLSFNAHIYYAVNARYDEVYSNSVGKLYLLK